MAIDTAKLPECLELVDGGAIRVRGHRVNLEHIVGAFEAGYTAESIATFFPTVKLAAIYATIAFYLANQPDVRAYIDEGDRKLDEFVRANPSKAPTLDELRRRLATKQEVIGEAAKTSQS